MKAAATSFLQDQLRVAWNCIKEWYNRFPLIVRFVLSGFIHLCRMLPVQSPERSIAGQNASTGSVSLDEFFMSRSVNPGEPDSNDPKPLTKDKPNETELRFRISSPDLIFGSYSKELIFGRQQSQFRRVHGSENPVDDNGWNDLERSSCSSRENTAKSLKNLIDRLGTSASLDRIAPYDEKLSLDEKLSSNSEHNDSIIKKTESFSKKNTSVINLRNCNLRIVKEVVKKLGLKDTKENTRDWDVYWTSNPISVLRCKTFNRFQRTNHFPESSRPLLKNNLAKYLTRMSLRFQQEYDFFPETWCLPEEYVYLEEYAKKRPGQWFIVKPHNCSSGHGIFLTKDLKELNNCGKMVCQTYVQRPLLIDGYKFDLRIYVLVTSCKPLRIFVYNEGFARLGTEPYQPPNRRNEKNRRMHLTNYSVNKYSPNCVIDDAKGTLRKLSAFYEWLSGQSIDVNKITDSVDDVIVKTTIAIAPVLSHYYYMSFPDQTDSNSCFQIFGFDVMFDENFKPYVLEVNTDPSLYADIQMERELKEELVLDTFNILNLSKKPRKTVWLNRPKSHGEKLINDKKLTQSRIEWENSHMGNYRKIYPNDNMAYYQEFLKTAEHIAMSI